MGSALTSSVSGLKAHSNLLDVIGNNLANLNTTGYKSQRALFSDLLYDSRRSASGSTGFTRGGINPLQVGSGVQIAQVDGDLSQGNLDATGNQFDLAIQGDGYFIAFNGTRYAYTRAGAFGLDATGRLVDPSTGFPIVRFGAVGEPDPSDPSSPSFQVPGDLTIRVPLGAVLPGTATTSIVLNGVLSSNASPPLAQVLTTASPFKVGGAAATAATLLNNLDTIIIPYAGGDDITITGVDHNGAAVNATLAVDNTTTLGDVVTAINAAFSGATASIDVNGNLKLTADATGTSFLSLVLADAGGNTGSMSFGNHQMATTTKGTDGGTFQSSVEIFDSLGSAQTVNLTFSKVDSDNWNLVASIDPSKGTLIDNTVQLIRFNEDGSFRQVAGSGTGDNRIILQLNGIPSPQIVSFNFGTANGFDGMTHLAAQSSLAAQQDGFGPGVLTAIDVDSDGTIQGIASNGRKVSLAQVAVASFRNPQGLVHMGNNYYQESLNSGEVQIGSATTGGRGAIFSGRLESSNVDIAVQLTKMIIAQRGFSANARSITVADRILEELTTLVR